MSDDPQTLKEMWRQAKLDPTKTADSMLRTWVDTAKSMQQKQQQIPHQKQKSMLCLGGPFDGEVKNLVCGREVGQRGIVLSALVKNGKYMQTSICGRDVWLWADLPDPIGAVDLLLDYYDRGA